MASEYSTSTHGRNGGPRCDCGLKMSLITSWTDDNPGRRFYGCPNYGVDRYCGYFEWYDPPVYSTSAKIIRGLLRKRNAHEKEIRELKLKLKIAVCLIVIPWIIFLSIWTIIMYQSGRRIEMYNTRAIRGVA